MLESSPVFGTDGFSGTGTLTLTVCPSSLISAWTAISTLSRQSVSNTTKGVDALYTISVGKIIGGVKASIGFVGSATGESACNAAKLQLLTFAYDEIDAAESAFKKSCEVLRTCDPKANNYKDCVNNFKNCFAIYTTTIKRLFEKMALASTGKMRDYYYYCSSQVSRMSIKNYNNMKIMTYEEYKKSF